MKVEYILQVICLLGVVQGFTIAVLLLVTSKRRRYQNILLSGIFASCALAMFIITLVNSGWVKPYNVLQDTEFFLGFLIGPMIYVYCQSQYQSTFQFKRYFGHFLPAILFIIWSILSSFTPYQVQIPVLLVMLHLQGYAVAGAILYFRRKKWANLFTTGFDMNWVPVILLLFLLLALAQWVRFSFSSIGWVKLMVPSIIALGFYFITTVLLKRSTWLIAISTDRRISNRKLNPNKVKELNHLMSEQAPYRNPQLNLSKLALSLDLHPNQLTRLIKQYFHCNFKDYINSYRVESAKTFLSDPQWHHLTIEAIGQEAGFKSRSAFYRIFKNVVKQTPASYKRSNLS